MNSRRIIMMCSYLVMVILATAIIQAAGLSGFLVLWLSTELAQLLYILRLNMQLFAVTIGLDMRPAYRLSVLLIAAYVACFAISEMFSQWSNRGALALTFAALVASTVSSYYLFGLRELQNGLTLRLFRRA